MPEIPREKIPDSTVPFLLDGYEFIAKRCRRYDTDLFRTRLLLQDTICMTGAEAAELFYDESRFIRQGAAPGRVLNTLFGRGGVQGLDGQAHRHRKQLFMSLMSPENVARLGELSAEQWRLSARAWERMPAVVLLDETRELLFRAACTWAGVPFEPSEVRARTNDVGDLIESGGAVGPKHWQGRLARQRAERWAAGLVRRARNGELPVTPEREALGAIAVYRDENGRPLDDRVAAVELLNVIRPTVAVAYFIVFLALALHTFADSREKLTSGEYDPEWFVQEVRRFYPFFPSVAARVRSDFEWRGYHFPGETRVLLDLYGTNRDPRLWEQPEQFNPARFRDWTGNPFTLIPQGGGDHYSGHRCPGEWITIELMKVALGMLSFSLRYDLPPQDLRMSLSRMPATPNSRFVIATAKQGA